MRALGSLLCAAVSIAPSVPASVRADVAAPAALGAARVSERPGVELPRDVRLTDHRGRSVRLGDYLDGERPVLLMLGYYSCPMLCDLVFSGAAQALAAAGRRPGSDFVALAVSIDPHDRPADARRKREQILGGAELADDAAWSFCVGDERAVRRIADAVGFGYAYDRASGQFAHAAVLFVIDPGGRVRSYLYGLTPQPDALDQALSLAAAGRSRSAIERVLLQCFHYVPALRRHAGAIALLLRLGGLAILASLGAVVLLAWRRRHASEIRS